VQIAANIKDCVSFPPKPPPILLVSICCVSLGCCVDENTLKSLSSSGITKAVWPSSAKCS